MQQEITSEFLKTLHGRANEFAIAKWGKQPDRITIDSDGTLNAIYDGYERGDETYETIRAEDLTSDLDAIAKERADKLRPCDCKDAVDTSKLQEQGIGHNDESITVIPNYVLLKMGHTEIKIGMKRFKMFAEWYLSEQDVRHGH